MHCFVARLCYSCVKKAQPVGMHDMENMMMKSEMQLLGHMLIYHIIIIYTGHLESHPKRFPGSLEG